MALIKLNNQSLTNVTAAGLPVRPSSVLQVKNTTFTGTNIVAFASNVDTKLTDLSVNITPTSTNSIIKIETVITGEHSASSAIYNTGWFFFRDNTALKAPNAGNRTAGIQMGTSLSYWAGDVLTTPENAAYMYFDSPNSTSQITYSAGLVSFYAGNWHLNKTVQDLDGVDHDRGISSICVTEIAG